MKLKKIYINKYIKRGVCILFFMSTVYTVSLADSLTDVKQSIISQSRALGVEPAIMLSIAKAESGFNQSAIGSGGTVGVFQLHTDTAKKMGCNPYIMEENVKCGILYYKKLYEMFNSTQLAVAAYNAGPEGIKRANYKVPLYSQKFVSKIMSDYDFYKKQSF